MPRAALLLLAVGAACGPSPAAKPGDDTGTPDAVAWSPPDVAGPFVPGTEVSSLTLGDGRAAEVQVWYPAAADAPGALHRYDGTFSRAALDAPPAACDGPRPVVVFSHGNGGVRWQSAFFTEHLASRGWVVIAPDHAGNTIFDDSATLAELVLRRPRDVAATFDHLLTLAGPGGILDGCVDATAGYAVVGHSFGGYTAFAVAGAGIDLPASEAHCASVGGWLCNALFTAAESEAPGATTLSLGDPRAWASVPLTPAGWEVLVGGLADIAVPTLVMGGGRDTLTPMDDMVRPMAQGLRAPSRALATLPDAGHYTFSDVCALAPTFEDCAPPYLDAATAHPLIAAVATAWLERELGNPEAAAFLPPDSPLLVWDLLPVE